MTLTERGFQMLPPSVVLKMRRGVAASITLAWLGKPAMAFR